MTHRTAWRTENWMRVGSEVFMVQQRWELFKEKNENNHRDRSYAYAAFGSFPTDEWRIVNLKEMVTDECLRKLLEAE